MKTDVVNSLEDRVRVEDKGFWMLLTSSWTAAGHIPTFNTAKDVKLWLSEVHQSGGWPSGQRLCLERQGGRICRCRC